MVVVTWVLDLITAIDWIVIVAGWGLGAKLGA